MTYRRERSFPTLWWKVKNELRYGIIIPHLYLNAKVPKETFERRVLRRGVPALTSGFSSLAGKVWTHDQGRHKSAWQKEERTQQRDDASVSPPKVEADGQQRHGEEEQHPIEEMHG